MKSFHGSKSGRACLRNSDAAARLADLKEALAWYENIHPDLGLGLRWPVDAAVGVVAQSPDFKLRRTFTCANLPLRLAKYANTLMDMSPG
jgi:hypothetical protein